MILAALWAAPVHASTWLTGWDHRVPITVQASQVIGTANLTNFPVYVNLGAAIPSASWAAIQADGGDIVVTDSTGTTTLLREVSALNTGAGTGHLYFRAPTLLAATNTRFFVYFGNDAANESNSTSVWSNGYYAVWHFEEGAANTQQDSGPNNIDATVGTAGSDVAGKVGGGISVTANSIYNATVVANASTALTFTAWTNRLTDALTANRWLLNTGNQASYFGWGTATPDPQSSYLEGSAWFGYGQNVGFPSQNVWSNMTWTRDGTATAYWANGDSVAAVTVTNSRSFTTPGTIQVNCGGGSGWVGYIDEYRIATVRRTSGWIKTEHNNIASAGTFYAVGSEQEFAGLPQVVIPDTVYAVVGRAMSIRYDQITPQIPEAVRITYGCTSAVGSVGASGFSYTPTETGSHQVIFSLADAWNDVTVKDTTTVVVVASDHGGGTKSVLFVGDSVAGLIPPGEPGNAYVPTYTMDYFTADGGAAIRLLGSQGDPHFHECRLGWDWPSFTTLSGGDNPFWDAVNSRIDFQKYIADSGLVGPIDFCAIQLGYNDLYGMSDTLDAAGIATITGHIDDFVDAMLSATTGYPNCKIVIGLPSAGNIDTLAWIDDYGSLTGWKLYEYNFTIYRNALNERYGSGAYHANVAVCGVGLWVDRVNGYPSNNYLHPNSTGAIEMADAFYAHLRALMPAAPSGGPRVNRNQSLGNGGSGFGGDLGGQ